MAESAALVPVPFYPPVRTGAHAFFKFGDPYRRPWPSQPQVRTVAPEMDTGAAYTRSGRFLTDGLVGLHVNIYV